MHPSSFAPPETVRGMTILDREKFTKNISVAILRIFPSMMNAVLVLVKMHLLKMEKLKPVQTDGADKLVLLNPDLITSFDCFSDSIRSCLRELCITSSNFEFRTVCLSYDNWKAHEIISAVLPAPLTFSGYSIIGHIIHVNLRNELLPYKNLIGEVLLEKVKNCRSVVNKVTNIQNTFRSFEMELLAGNSDFTTQTLENGCRFELNFSEVYWNPRLHAEHGRIVHLLNPSDVLYDAFCGIGPFAIPAAKKGCTVFANDLNPACCEWLNRNANLNKVPDLLLRVFNKSAAEFIKDDFRNNYIQQVCDAKYKGSSFHIVMNLPATAHSFLTCFQGLYLEKELDLVEEHQLPIVHVYCFASIADKTDGKMTARNLVEQSMKMKICDSKIKAVHVRNVSPSKDMIRVYFTMPKDFLVRSSLREHVDEKMVVDCIEDVEMSSPLVTNGKRYHVKNDECYNDLKKSRLK